MARTGKPIQHQLVAMILLTSAAAIALTAAAFVIYELIAIRRQTQEQVGALARIISANSTAALAFRNEQDAVEVLAALKAEPQIVAAALYDNSGELFAGYRAKDAETLPTVLQPDGYRFRGGSLEGHQPVSEQGNRRLGTLYIRSDMRARYQRFWLYGLIAAGTTAASLLLAYALSRVFQRRISGPIISLTETARAVSERADFSVRAPMVGEAEFRVLTTTFNQMLGRIGTQNAELQENEERLRAVLNSALSAVVVMDANGAIVDWNARAESIFGWKREEALGRPLAETIIPLRDREAHYRGMKKFLTTGVGSIINRTIELAALRRDGSEFPVEISISAMHAHESVTFCGFITDITERKLARSKLQEQLARLDLLHRTTRAIGERQDLQSIFQVILRNLEDNLPVDFGCICLCDAQTHWLSVESIGTNSTEHAAKAGIEMQARFAIAQNGLSRCIDGVLVYEPDIGKVPYPLARQLHDMGLRSLVAAPLLVEKHVFGILLAARLPIDSFSSADCEFLRQLSEHLALAAHQVQLYTSLQQAYEDLRLSQQTVLQQERLRALGQMASGVAHDINNAISPVALYTESLLEREPDLTERGREQLRIIQRAIEDVSQTVARMREFYRQREQPADLAPIDLNPLIGQVLNLTHARWSDIPQERGIVINVRTELEEELPKIMGMESDVRDALTNLIFNAVDAMPEGGTLTLRTRVAAAPGVEPAVLLEVSDTGIGMDEDTRRRCLEPFFTTKGERGTGMGLAMVYGMVKRHGAQIDIDSARGHGTTMRLTFTAAAASATAQVHLPAPQIAARHLRVLVVDDDPLVAESLHHILQNDGHTVAVADGGQAGIDAFTTAHHEHHDFDIVMTDLGMPYVDGRAVAAAVKTLSAHTPILLLTGWGQRLSTEQSVPVNVDRVLSKPPKLPELRRVLAELTAAKDPWSTAEGAKDRLAR